MNTIKAVFIDKQIMFVQAMKALLETIKHPSIKIVGHFVKVESFFEEFDDEANVVIIDINVDDIEGLNFISDIKKKYSGIKILVLSSYAEYKFVREAMQKGADSYILKSSDFTDFEMAIIEILEDRTFLGNNVHLTPPATIFKNGFKVNERKSGIEDRFQIRQKLTKREMEILRLITQAKSNDEIGDILYISDQTVGVHKKNIMRKLGMKSTMTLIKYAIENELV